MLPIQDSRVSISNGRWFAECKCGKISGYSTKASCLRMLDNGVCSFCKPDYRTVRNQDLGIYKRQDGKWCSVCAGCGVEQAYTRKDHAKQSELNNWRCKPCNAKDKSFNANLPVGNKQRIYNRFKKSSKTRGISWKLSIDEMFFCFDKKCALTGWDISIDYKNETASLDRIDSSKGYEQNNIQWVHTMVNMCKNKYDQGKFIEMCKAIANNTNGSYIISVVK
jgi:hypothetical protein